jgi:hypothetical protein
MSLHYGFGVELGGDCITYFGYVRWTMQQKKAPKYEVINLLLVFNTLEEEEGCRYRTVSNI